MPSTTRRSDVTEMFDKIFLKWQNELDWYKSVCIQEVLEHKRYFTVGNTRLHFRQLV